MVNNQLDQTSQTLLDYIEAAVDSLPEEAIEAIQSLLQNADLSYVCKETGETLFHKMATYWDLNLMDVEDRPLFIQEAQLHQQTPTQ